MRFGALLRELARSGPGKVGLAMLAIMCVISVWVVATYPPAYGTSRWGNPGLWADNPKAAPPAWTAWFDRDRHVRHLVMEAGAPTQSSVEGSVHRAVYAFTFDHRAQVPPTSLIVSLRDVEYRARPPVVSVTLERPDGHTLLLYRAVVAGPRPGEPAPYRRHADVPLRVSLGDEQRALDSALALLAAEYAYQPSPGAPAPGRALRALFGVPADQESTGEAPALATLTGTYRLVVDVAASNPDDRVGSVRAVVGGSVFGWMGTDALGRDLFEGLLYGLPVALLIGLATSTVSTALGTALGLVSGYLGGWVDTVIQRLADIVANVPALPLLIFLVFIGGSQLWIILLVLVAFSWPGLTITVRSMVLQHRSGTEVEAARALGASNARIIWRHVFPHTAAFIFAQLVFFAPSAVLAEAGLSFLGLGDPSIPTWGQILEHGFRTGAVFLGYWWWVIPPGVLIVLTALTFMLLALGVEPAVDPRLRRSRGWRSSM